MAEDPWAAFNLQPEAGAKADPWAAFKLQPETASAGGAPQGQQAAQYVGKTTAPAQPAPDLSDPDMRAAVERSYIGRIWDNFRSGFNEGAAGSIFNAKGREPDAPPDPIGFNREQVELLQKHGLMRTGGEGPVDSVIKAADELFYYRGAQVLDGFMRTGQGLFRGMQAAGLAAGLPRDIVAIPEAFQGSPGVVTAHDVVPSPIGPVRYGMERAAELAGKRVDVTRLAPELEANPPPPPIQRSSVRTGISEVDSIIASPVTTDAIDNPVIDRSHKIPYMAGGSVPLEDPTVYIDKHVPKEQTAPRAPLRADGPSFFAYHGTPHDFDAFDVAKIGTGEGAQSFGHGLYFSETEDVARSYRDKLAKDESAALYRVRINADREQFLDWDKPLSEQPETWDKLKAYGFPGAKESGGLTGRELVEGSKNEMDEAEASRMFREAGIPGIKYLDQKSRNKPTEAQTRNFVVFDQNLVQVTEKNGKTVGVTFDPAEPWTIHENVEQHVMELLIKGGMKADEAYRVAHWKFAEPAEQAWYRAHDIDQVAAEKEQQTWLPKIQHEDIGKAPSAEILPPGTAPTGTPTGDYFRQIAEGETELPSSKDLTAAIDKIDQAEQAHEGFDEATHKRLKMINRMIDAGGPAADEAIAEKDRLLAQHPAPEGELDVPDKAQVKQLATEFSSLERQGGESLKTYEDGVARVLKRYASKVIEGDDFAKAVFRKAFVEAQKNGLDTQKLTNDVLNRYLGDIASPSDRKIMKEEFESFLRPKLEAPAAPTAPGTTDVPSNLYKKPYPHSDVAGAKHESVEEAQPSDDEVARAMDIIQRSPELKPELAQVGLQAAKDLGVIGPGKPRIDNLAPKEAAATAIPGPKVTQEVGEQPNPWQQRFEHFVSNLKAPDEVQNLIREAAKVNGDFEPARQGEIPLSHVESIAEAAGVEPGTVDPKGLGRLLKNDAEVRTSMQLMLQVTQNLQDAARIARADASPENLIALQEAIMRRDMAVEQVVGLRAEWGRTGKVFQEFLQNVKDQQALDEFLKGQGRDTEGLKKIADAIGGLNSPGAIARFANDMRKPTFWDKYLFYWVNALISGPITHAKYIGANAAFAAYEAGVVTPIAGALGTARRAVTGSSEGVMLGEGPARVWGLLAGTPDALRAAYRAAKENIQVPLPGEVAKGVNPLTQQKSTPIEGPLGVAIGIPSRGAAAIHSFYRLLGYRAEIEARAYRQATEEGLTGDAFWRRRQALADNPDSAMMDKAIESGNRLTFLREPGQFGKWVQRTTNARFNFPGTDSEWQPFKLIMPFTQIPGQILRAFTEQTAAAPLDQAIRADILGKNGAAAQDMAVARIVGGTAISAMTVNWALNDNITGYGPTDPNERKLWLLTHQPYSVRLGNHWISYDKFGVIGDLMGTTANLVDIGAQVKAEEYKEAAGRLAKASFRLIEDEVGMQGLVNLIEAMQDPDKNAGRYLSSLVASNLPYSSALRQVASFNDPYMRDAKTFIDQLRYNTPWSRQELLPKRDWLGAPMPNPGYATILRQREVNADPIDLELQRLQIHPTPPQDRIGGVKLTPQLYDEYQTTAGPLTREIVGSMVESPGWRDLPDYLRETAIRHGIEAGRKQGAAAMQMQHPQLVLDGLQQRIDHITGAAHTSRPKNPPANLENEMPAEPQ